jgi:integrase
MKRKQGHANVEEHTKGSGKHRVRARVKGKLVTVASGLSKSEANEVANAYAVVRNEKELHEGITLGQFGVGFLDRRERNGVRGIATDRSYWRQHVAGGPVGREPNVVDVPPDPISALPISSLTRRDVLDWLDRRKRSHRTRKKALCLLRVCLQEALDRELIQHNPARDVRVHKSGDRTATDDLAGILTPAEQKALIAAVPESQRPLVVFSLLTGLRQAEQWWLQQGDVYHGHIVVRRSRRGLPPKSGKNRTVYLLGPAEQALKVSASEGKYVWPAKLGGRRQEGKAPKGWKQWVRDAGINRRIVWKDLRHTCATALLAGWWGRKWTIDEVCQHLGHSSVKVTEIYARKLAETNQLAVAQTVFPESSPLMLKPMTNPAKNKGADSGIRTRDLRFTNSGRTISSSGRLLGGVFPRGNVSAEPSVWALALAAESAGLGVLE